VLQHVPLCTAVPGDVVRKELTSNSQFVLQAKGIKSHKGIERLVQHIFKAGITTSMSSEIRADLLEADAYEGYEDGFTKVRDLLDAIVAANPGTVYELMQATL
jgi:hypothetical protein